MKLVGYLKEWQLRLDRDEIYCIGQIETIDGLSHEMEFRWNLKLDGKKPTPEEMEQHFYAGRRIELTFNGKLDPQ